MKVLIISPCILPVPAVKGGAVLTLIESIIAKNEINKEMDLTVIGSYDEKAVEKSKEYPNTNFIFLKKLRVYDIIDGWIDGILERVKKDKPHQYLWKYNVIYQLKKILQKNDYDRVIFQNSGYLINVLKDKTIVDKYEGKLYYHLHNDIPDNIYRQGVNKCKLILISNYLSKKVNTICEKDMKKQILLVKNGIKAELFAQRLNDNDRRKLMESLNIEENKKIIIYAGRIIAAKGISQLLDAYIKLCRKDVVLLIVGTHNFGSGQTSSFEKNLRNSFEMLKYRVIFTGFIPYEEMWKYYQLGDVAVLPSMWEEPAGLTMIEAAAAGIPVITTISGGIPEYLNKEMALLVNRDERIVENLVAAINEVLDNPSMWSEKAIKSAAYVRENFSEEVFYEQFVDSIK